MYAKLEFYLRFVGRIWPNLGVGDGLVKVKENFYGIGGHPLGVLDLILILTNYSHFILHPIPPVNP
jgi:hypothetical protein